MVNLTIQRWPRWSVWASIQLAVLPFVQGCMFSVGYYLAKLKLLPLMFGAANRAK